MEGSKKPKRASNLEYRKEIILRMDLGKKAHSNLETQE